jgi:raffinose/stachyose/melibiose transport system substrate-binding protein
MTQADTSGVVEPGSSLESGIEAWRTLAENDTFIPYLDWATPTFYDTVTAAIQELLGGKASPEEFNAKLQNDYAKFIESR